MKNIFWSILRIVIGLILSRIIIGIINYLVGIFLYMLIDYNVIDMDRSAELLKLSIVIYLPFLIVLIILGIMIVKDSLKDKKSNVVWKSIVLLLTYLSFEFL